MNNTAILVMAAGSSRRFGSDKRQARIEHKTLLEATLEKAAPWKESIRVILGPGDETLQQTLSAQGITAYIAENAQRGMGHSLADSIGLLSMHDPMFRQCLIMLADMPFLKTSTLKTLLNALQNNELVVPTYQGKRGNPVGFGQHYFSELAKLTGDSGGKIILLRNENSIQEIPVDDIGILMDIDRPEQLIRSAENSADELPTCPQRPH